MVTKKEKSEDSPAVEPAEKIVRSAKKATPLTPELRAALEAAHAIKVAKFLAGGK